MARKFKVGDKVKLIGKQYGIVSYKGRGFNLKSTGIVQEYTKGLPYPYSVKNCICGRVCDFNAKELEKIK